MTLVVAAAPLQWAFASATQSSALSQNSPFNNQAPASVVQTDKTHSVKGHVADGTGEPLIGATVAVEGTNLKTVTDIDGNFSINLSKAPATAMLRISYMGYKDKVVNGAANLNVTMQLDQQSIDEVVVTALGIKREKKMLGYSVQEVKADKLNVTGDPSVVGALDGKVAGLQMNTASTGLGGSTKITIRGNSSLTDNNQPLWIVDGVPFTDDQTSSASTYGGYDRGGTSFDINPEDIESISVLKGPNAAALYGSRAGNGVILVTTKRGSHKQGFGVSYSGNFTWSQAAETLKMQKLYGQGSQGQFLFNEDENGNKTTMTGELAFGPRFDGSMQTNWLGEKAPYSYTGDRLKDYFRTGFSQAHTVAVGTSSEKSHFRLSVGYNGNDGLFKNESLNKINVDLNAGATINEWLSLDGKISVSNTKAENRPYTGLNGEVAQLLLMPGNVSLRDLEQNYTSPNKLHQNWFGPDQHYSNPYYARHRFKNSDERWRAFGYYSANVNLTDWLKFNAKYSFDYYRTRLQTSDLSLGDGAISTDGTGWQGKLVNDGMTRAEENHFEQNIQFLLMGDNQLAKKWRLGYTAGANIMYLKFEQLSASVQNMLEKDNWIFNTGNKLTSALDDGHSRAMYSAFASAQLAYDEWLSLDITARNDWSSALTRTDGTGSNSYFYPSVSLSAVMSDILKLPRWVNYWNVRVGYAEVGSDTDPYRLQNVYAYAPKYGSISGVVLPSTLADADLKPERMHSWEAGTDITLFDNRLSLGLTYYNTLSSNQIVVIPISNTTGYSSRYVNAGDIRNQGIELSLAVTPLRLSNSLTWQSRFNFSRNVGKVEKIAKGYDQYVYSWCAIYSDQDARVYAIAKEGERMGNLYGTGFKHTPDGSILVDESGLPVADPTLVKLGNYNPDFILGWSNSLRYKGFSLDFLLDWHQGGVFVSRTFGMGMESGVLKQTEDRTPEHMVVKGECYDAATDQYVTNTKQVSPRDYYRNLYRRYHETQSTFSATFLKLREVSIGYDLPKRWLSHTPIKALNFSIVGRNLWMWTKGQDMVDPEAVTYEGNSVTPGVEEMSYPTMRSLGFSVHATF